MLEDNQRMQRLLSDIAEQLQQLIELRDATYKELDSIRKRQSDITEAEQQNVRRCYSEKKSGIVRFIINRYKAYLYVTENSNIDEILRSFTTIAMSLEDDFNIGGVVDYFKKMADRNKLVFNVTESLYGETINCNQYNALPDTYCVTPLVL